MLWDSWISADESEEMVDGFTERGGRQEGNICWLRNTG